MSSKTNIWHDWKTDPPLPGDTIHIREVDGVRQWCFAQDSGEMSPPAGKPPGFDQPRGVRVPQALRDEELFVALAEEELPLLDKYFSVQETLNARGARYGDFTDNARISQALKSVVESEVGYTQSLNDVQREAISMILQKIARILNGDPNYKDNWHDIQGYARLAEERCSTDQIIKSNADLVPAKHQTMEVNHD